MQHRPQRSAAAQSRAAPAAPSRVLPTVSTRSRRTAVFIRAAGTVSTNDFKNGLTVEVDGVPFKVTEFLHVKPGKGAAFVRSKLKNMLTGATQERTFRAGETLQIADMMRRDAQFTYADGDTYVFMDMESYEETRLPRDDYAKYLKEGAICSLLSYNGKVISVEPPQFVELEVTDCPPNVKGNTASGGGSKPATLETGAIVTVPLFINVGELIKIDTKTETYLSRAKE